MTAKKVTIGTVSISPTLPTIVRTISVANISKFRVVIKLDVPVLIFDEVDSGVGGAVAEVVGKELRAIGEHRQVMCITHLAQVAANAHHHYRVNKQSEASDTASAIEYLSQADRITEIARMIGGVTLTENTFLHAQEMLEASTQQH